MSSQDELEELKMELKVIKDNGTAEGAAKQDKLVAVPSPKEQEQEPASLGSSSALEKQLTALSTTTEPLPEDASPNEKVRQFMIEGWINAAKIAGNFTSDVGSHIISTNPLDTLAGPIDAGISFTSSFFAASVAPIRAADVALTGKNRNNFEVMKDEFGYDDVILDPRMSNAPDNQKVFMAVYGETLESLTLPTATKTGEAIVGFVEDIINRFGEDGEYVGAFADKYQGPIFGTAVESVIKMIPFVAPIIVGKGLARHKKNKIKQDRIDKIVDRLQQLEKTEEIKPPVAIQKATIPEQLTPTEALARLDLPLIQEHGLSPQKFKTYQDTLAEKGQIDPIMLNLDSKGKLTLRNKNDIDTIRILEKLGNKPAEFRIVMDAVQAKTGKITRASLEEGARRVNKMQDIRELELIKIENKNRKSLLQKSQTSIFDTSSEVKTRLLKQGGAIGEAAVMRKELMAGAGPNAQRIVQGMEKKVYHGLSKTDTKHLDNIIFSRRVVAIDTIKGEGIIKHPNNTTKTDHQASLLMLEEKLGKEKYQDLYARSGLFDQARKDVIIKKYAEGLINKKQFNAMKDVFYEPRKMLNILDPARTTIINGKVITVRDSGLSTLSKGAIKSLENNSRLLLTEYIVRNENIIMRNKANKAMLNFAELIPDNGWVKSIPKGKRSKVPDRMTKLDVIVDGDLRSMLMDTAMAEQWVTSKPQITNQAAESMRILSGSYLVRPLATGYNPEFAIKNFAKDLAHAYVAVDYRAGFSPQAPKYGIQMAGALKNTFKDAIKKEGAYIDFVKEGGGMNFLTHQGTNLFNLIDKEGRPIASPNIHLNWRKLKEVGSKVNEVGEIWVRLAIRDQAIKNGVDPEMATWFARSYLDFSIQGRLTGTYDHVIPYMNASTQAFKTTARALKAARPSDRLWGTPLSKDFLTKAMWLQSSATAIWMNNYYNNKDMLIDLDPDILRKNWVFGTGLSFVDKQENKIHHYITVPKENSMIPFTYMVESALERYMLGRVPNRNIIDTMKASIPIIPTESLPPTFSALMVYSFDYDPWTDNKVWGDRKGLPVGQNPSEEFTEFPDRPVSPFYKDVADMAGLSPFRTEKAMSKLLPNNTFTSMSGMGYKMLTEGMNDFDKSRHTLELLNETPGFRKMMGLTHPMTRAMDEGEYIIATGSTFKIQYNRKLDNLYAMHKQGDLTGGRNTIMKWIAAQDPSTIDSGRKRLNTMFTYDRIMRTHADVQGVPSRGIFANWVQQDGITRADLYYQKWKNSTTKVRGIMDRIIGSMSSGGLGFRSDSFNRRLNNNKTKYGTHEPDRFEEKKFIPTKRPIIKPRK